MGNDARIMALGIILVFFIGTGIGSALPEFGNLVATRINIGSHSFNVLFLALGIIGIGVALYLGYTYRGTGT